MDNFSEQMKSLLSSPLGQELIRSLEEDLHHSIIQDAESAVTQETAYGLLKEASGVIKSVNHLRFLSVTPSSEGNKDTN